MLRHIVLLKLKGPVAAARIDEIRGALLGLDCPGRTAMWMGVDAGMRPGNMDLAIVADFADEGAYRAYDADVEHDRIRREMIAPIAERVERCQFVI